MDNIIYVMTNSSMPGLVKIGVTGDLQDRLASLYTTAIPLPFEVHFAAKVEEAERVEKTLHQIFADHRINPRREFFRVAPEKVVLAIGLAPHTDVTPSSSIAPDTQEEADAIQREFSRRSRISLDALRIPVGAELTFSRDETLHARVVAGNKIELDGEVLSLTASASKILQRMGRSGQVSGSVYWTYEGETLEERRLRMEEEQFEE